MLNSHSCALVVLYVLFTGSDGRHRRGGGGCRLGWMKIYQLLRTSDVSTLDVLLLSKLTHFVVHIWPTFSASDGEAWVGGCSGGY